MGGGSVDVTVAEPVTEPTLALMVALPGFWATTRPGPATATVLGSLLFQVAVRVTSCCEPSEKTAVAVIGKRWPT